MCQLFGHNCGQGPLERLEAVTLGRYHLLEYWTALELNSNKLVLGTFRSEEDYLRGGPLPLFPCSNMPFSMVDGKTKTHGWLKKGIGSWILNQTSTHKYIEIKANPNGKIGSMIVLYSRKQSVDEYPQISSLYFSIALVVSVVTAPINVLSVSKRSSIPVRETWEKHLLLWFMLRKVELFSLWEAKSLVNSLLS